MLEQIEDMLEETYENLKAEVEYKDVRQYEIKIGLETRGITFEKKIIYIWNYHLTSDVNLARIKEIIDKEIILNFYKKGE